MEDLILFDLATNTKRVLEHSSGDNVVLHVSANGERLLLERAGIARVLAMPSGLETHLLLEDAASATISGDGRIAFASSRGGSLWRFDLETRAYEEWLAPAAELQFPAESAVPGSLFTLRGRIADVASTESGAVAATSLAGFEALLDGEPLPMFKVGPRELRVQIPWESNIAPSRRLEIRHQRNPYFLSALGLVAVRPAPLVQFERLSGYFEGPLVAPHADFRGIATPEDPAVPGETLHLYATGLGPVTTGFATTGQRTPLGSHPVVNMPTCQISAPRVNGIPTPVTALPLRYAGLAGALLGLYQLDVTLPAELPTAELGGVTYVNLQCGYSSAPQSFLNLVPVRIPIKP